MRKATVTHYVADHVGVQSVSTTVVAHYAGDSVLVGPSDLRVTAAGANVLFLPDRDIRVTQAGADVLYVPDPAVRATIVEAEVLYQQDPAFVEPLIKSLADYARSPTLEDFTRTAVPEGWGTGALGTWVQTFGGLGSFYTDGSGGVAVSHYIPASEPNPWAVSRVRLPLRLGRQLEFVTTSQQFSAGTSSSIGGFAQWGWEAVDELDRPLWRINFTLNTSGSPRLELYTVWRDNSFYPNSLTPAFDEWVSTDLAGVGIFQNPAQTAGAPVSMSMRVLVDAERIWVRVWNPDYTSEPTAWHLSHPYMAGYAAAPPRRSSSLPTPPMGPSR